MMESIILQWKKNNKLFLEMYPQVPKEIQEQWRRGEEEITNELIRHKIAFAANQEAHKIVQSRQEEETLSKKTETMRTEDSVIEETGEYDKEDQDDEFSFLMSEFELIDIEVLATAQVRSKPYKSRQEKRNDKERYRYAASIEMPVETKLDDDVSVSKREREAEGNLDCVSDQSVTQGQDDVTKLYVNNAPQGKLHAESKELAPTRENSMAFGDDFAKRKREFFKSSMCKQKEYRRKQVPCTLASQKGNLHRRKTVELHHKLMYELCRRTIAYEKHKTNSSFSLVN